MARIEASRRVHPGGPSTTQPSILPAGDCEDLSALQSAGWRNFRHEQEAIGSHVELTPAAPAGGKNCLHLAAFPTDEKNKPAHVDTPPVWVTTSPVNVAAGTIVAITAHVRVSAPVSGSVDSLVVSDSIGGSALAMRVGPKPNWQPIELFRVAVVDGPMSVTFALSGLGEAWVDEVAVRPVARFSAPRLPKVELPHEEVSPARAREPIVAPSPVGP
jgi:hypothetical protein